MNPREHTSIRLVPEQAEQLRAIGRMETLAQPIRTLAWLITRYAESLTTADVARAVGVTPSSARYWRGEFAKDGMTIFSRHVSSLAGEAEGADHPICVEDLREHGFDRRRSQYIEGVVDRMFDALRDQHRLGEDSRVLLERAAAYHDLGPEAVGFDDDGIFFTVLDPLLQRLPVREQRLLATIVRYLPEHTSKHALDKTGLSAAERNHALYLLALMRMAVATDMSRTQRIRIRRIDATSRAIYIAVQGAQSAETAAAIESSARLWGKLTGQRGRAFAFDALRLEHPGVDIELYSKRPRTAGVRADDRLDIAARKVLRFELIQMMRREAAAFIGENPEGVHKMRVATRRIRSALNVFRAAVGRRNLKDFRKRFQGLARTLGVARDLDVLMKHFDEYRDGVGEQAQRELDLFATDLFLQRLDASIDLREMLRSKRYARLLASFQAFTDPDRIGKARTKWRAKDAAPVHMYRELAAVGVHERGMNDADVDELHEMRIAFKRLRYTIGFYQDILGKESAELIEHTKVVQEDLGAIQDAQRACEIIDAFLARIGAAGAVPALLAYRDARAGEITQRAEHFTKAWNTEGPGLRGLLARSLEAL